MAKRLRVPLGIDASGVTQGARRAREELRDAGRAGGKAGGDIQDGMDKAARGTDALFGKLMALGGTYLSLQQLHRVITGIVDSYNRAIELRRELTQTTAGMHQAIAGAASQFGISEAAMRQMVGGIGVAAGAGKGDIAAISALVTSAASAGLIGAPTAAGFSPEDQAKLIAVATFAQYTGQPEAAAEMAKLFRKGLTGQELTARNLQQVIGQTVATYRQSQLANWGEFITGAVGGTSALLEQGIGFPTVMGLYGGLAKMTKSGEQAGETLRLLGTQLFTVDRPEIIKWIDQRYGPGAYFKMKAEDPNKLFEVMLAGLLEPTGQERAQLYARLKITPELSGRLAEVKGAGPEIRGIRGAIGAATAGRMAGELHRWRTEEERATIQAGELAAALGLAEAGQGRERAYEEALRATAEAEAKIYEAAHPRAAWARRIMWRWTPGLFEGAMLKERLRREYAARGVSVTSAFEALRVTLGPEGLRIDSALREYQITPGLRAEMEEEKQRALTTLREVAGEPLGGEISMAGPEALLTGVTGQPASMRLPGLPLFGMGISPAAPITIGVYYGMTAAEAALTERVRGDVR